MSRAIAEQILGAVFDADGPLIGVSPSSLVESTGLRVEDFDFGADDQRLKTAWRIVEMLARKRRPISARAVWSAGVSAKMLAEADRDYFAGLQAANQLDADSFGSLVDDFRGVLRRRSLIGKLDEYLAQLRENRIDVPSAGEALQQYLADLAAFTSADGDGSSDVLEVSDDWDRVEAGERVNITPSGIEYLDKLLGGGFRPTLTVIMAQGGVGKSALMASSIDAQLGHFDSIEDEERYGQRIGVFSLEDGSSWIFRRLVARDLGMAYGDVGVVHRSDAQRLKYQEIAARHHRRLRRLVVYRHDEIDTHELVARGRGWAKRLGVRTVWVDNGSEVTHRNPVKKDEAEAHRLSVGASYGMMRRAAVDTNTPWVVLAHTGRPPDDAERPPQAKEIAESAYIERRARVIVGLWEREKDGGDFIRATTAKNQFGAKNQTVRLPRIKSAALVTESDGDFVNLYAEKMAEIREASEKRKAKAAEEKAAKEEAKAKADAAKKKQLPQMGFGE